MPLRTARRKPKSGSKNRGCRKYVLKSIKYDDIINTISYFCLLLTFVPLFRAGHKSNCTLFNIFFNLNMKNYWFIKFDIYSTLKGPERYTHIDVVKKGSSAEIGSIHQLCFLNREWMRGFCLITKKRYIYRKPYFE